jgi:hypothetical protein
MERNMKTQFTVAVFAVAILTGAIPSPSFAQSDQGGGAMGMMGGDCPTMGMMGGSMMGQGMMGQGMMGGRQARMGPMVDGRLAYLKGELKITDAQNEAWNGYAEAVKGRMNVMQGTRQGMMDAIQQGGAVERMDARIGGMESMLEAMKNIKPATVKLYSALTDEQKKIADQLIGVACGAM